MYKSMTIMLACFGVALVASQAMATPINIDATFSTGASLGDNSFVKEGSAVDPNTNVSGGVWTNTRTATAGDNTSYWSRDLLPTLYTGNVVHGLAEITVSAFSTAPAADVMVQYSFSTSDLYSVGVFVKSGYIGLYDWTAGPATETDISVANTDSLKHTYGWELNRTAKTEKLFFDGVQVGTLGGYSVSSADNGNMFHIGDVSAGSAHSEVWDRVVIAEGAYPVVPEPSTVVLLTTGLIGLLAYAWRKRR